MDSRVHWKRWHLCHKQKRYTCTRSAVRRGLIGLYDKYSTRRNNTRGMDFQYLVRWVDLYFWEVAQGGKICGSGMENRNRYSGTVSNVNRCCFCIVCGFSVFLRILFNCAFNAFYKVNHGLQVPRETRLEKSMRLLEVLNIEKNAWRKS